MAFSLKYLIYANWKVVYGLFSLICRFRMSFMNFFKIQISSLVSLPVTAVFIFFSLLFLRVEGCWIKMKSHVVKLFCSFQLENVEKQRCNQWFLILLVECPILLQLFCNNPLLSYQIPREYCLHTQNFKRKI